MTGPRHTPPTAPGRSLLRWLLASAAVVFGVLTVVSGGKVLFGGAAARAEAGAVVDFVLGFNFAAGFAYAAAGIGIVLRRSWALPLARILAASTVLVFAALGIHIATGGLFELRTVAAMTVRSAFWVGQAVALATLLRYREPS